jgi:hypothetical protein
MVNISTQSFSFHNIKIEESELIDLDFFFGEKTQDIYNFLDKIQFEVDDRIIDQIWNKIDLIQKRI